MPGGTFQISAADLIDELLIDIFAGGGGASEGIEEGVGRPVDHAVNHDPEAIAMHKANHPKTRHYTEDVWRWKFRDAIGDRRVGVFWASPDCTQHSRAKGGKPIRKHLRSLAWVVPRIIAGLPEAQRPRILCLENVVEFEDWGPVVPRWRCADCKWSGTEGQMRLAERARHRRVCPSCDSRAVVIEKDAAGEAVQMADPARRGITFRRFLSRLRSVGYANIEHKMLDAADYGAPTHRRRLFLIARRDGHPIVWPEKTHADPAKIDGGDMFVALKPYRQAAECMDWTIPVPSIFMTQEQGRGLGLNIKRPLAEATQRRIAHGVKRYVLDTDSPFIAPFSATIEDDVIVPHVFPVTHHGERPGKSGFEPFDTITGAHRGEHAVVASTLMRYNGDEGREANIHDLLNPLNTLPTENRFGLIAATMVSSGYGERDGQSPRTLDVRKPLGAAVNGVKAAIVAAFLAKHYGGHLTPGISVKGPFDTITAQDHHAVVAAHLVHLNHGGKQDSSLREPHRTAMAGGNHAALVYAFLTRYFGNALGGAMVQPLGTQTAKDRTGLVLVKAYGQLLTLVDIGMRMLVPRELALGQGFRPTYILTGTKTSQVKRIGNSVSPVVPAAIMRANYRVGVTV